MSLTIPQLLAFGGVLAVLALVPGPTDVVLITRALDRGVCDGLGMVAGIAVADLLFVLAAAFGLTLLDETMPALLNTVRYACAAYLTVLAVMAWRAAPAGSTTEDARASAAGGFFVGLLLTFSDPKALVFYVALLPAFLEPARTTLPDVAFVALTVTMVIVLLKGAFVALAARVRERLAGGPLRVALQRASAVVLGAVALALLLQT